MPCLLGEHSIDTAQLRVGEVNVPARRIIPDVQWIDLLCDLTEDLVPFSTMLTQVRGSTILQELSCVVLSRCCVFCMSGRVGLRRCEYASRSHSPTCVMHGHCTVRLLAPAHVSCPVFSPRPSLNPVCVCVRACACVCVRVCVCVH